MTDFTVLFGGIANGGKCGGDNSANYILGSAEKDGILIGSVVGFVLLVSIIFIVIYIYTPLGKVLIGKEGTRVKKVRVLRLKVDESNNTPSSDV